MSSPGMAITRLILTICATLAAWRAALRPPRPFHLHGLDGALERVGVANVTSRFSGALASRGTYVSSALAPRQCDERIHGADPGSIRRQARRLRPRRDVAAQYDVAAWARRCRLRAGLERELKPERLSDTLAFMFETRHAQHLTAYAASLSTLQQDYVDCWSTLPKRFDGSPEGLDSAASRKAAKL